MSGPISHECFLGFVQGGRWSKSVLEMTISTLHECKFYKVTTQEFVKGRVYKQPRVPQAVLPAQGCS